MDNAGDVLHVGMFEAETVKGFEQIAGGADSLGGGVAEVVDIGLGVDGQDRCAVERLVSVGRRIVCLHLSFSVRFRIAPRTIESSVHTRQYGLEGQIV